MKVKNEEIFCFIMNFRNILTNPSKITDKGAGPPGREVILSLQKADSLLVIVNAR